MNTSLELINMSKATSEQQKNSPWRSHIYLKQHADTKWNKKFCPFHPTPYSHSHANRHCSAFSQIVYSQKVTAPRPRVLILLTMALTAALDFREIPADQPLRALRQGWVLSSKSFVTKKDFRKDVSERKGNFTRLFQIFQAFCFRNHPPPPKPLLRENPTSR